MSKGILAILGVITGLIIVALCICLEGLIVWGIGSLIIFAFDINFQFTYLMALAIALVLDILGFTIR